MQRAIAQSRAIDPAWRSIAPHEAARDHAGDICRRGGALHRARPRHIGSGLSALLIFYHSAEAASYKIEVTPGDASVPRGGDPVGHAKLKGFVSRTSH